MRDVHPRDGSQSHGEDQGSYAEIVDLVLVYLVNTFLFCLRGCPHEIALSEGRHGCCCRSSLLFWSPSSSSCSSDLPYSEEEGRQQQQQRQQKQEQKQGREADRASERACVMWRWTKKWTLNEKAPGKKKETLNTTRQHNRQDNRKQNKMKVKWNKISSPSPIYLGPHIYLSPQAFAPPFLWRGNPSYQEFASEVVGVERIIEPLTPQAERKKKGPGRCARGVGREKWSVALCVPQLVCGTLRWRRKKTMKFYYNWKAFWFGKYTIVPRFVCMCLFVVVYSGGRVQASAIKSWLAQENWRYGHGQQARPLPFSRCEATLLYLRYSSCFT